MSEQKEGYKELGICTMCSPNIIKGERYFGMVLIMTDFVILITSPMRYVNFDLEEKKETARK